MSFEVGREKTGGRQKGTPNKRTSDLVEILDAHNIDLPSQILNLLPKLEPEKQVDVLLHLMPYVYAKRKTVEMVVEVPGDLGLDPWEIGIMQKYKKMTPEQRKDEIDQLITTRKIIEEENRSIADAQAKRSESP